jgi:hypothetical protein
MTDLLDAHHSLTDRKPPFCGGFMGRTEHYANRGDALELCVSSIGI